ncbi:MAG: aspartate carbamoyltransferase catalytic subunit [Candidatus Eisenbacteria bacterium]
MNDVRRFQRKHLLGLEDLTREEILTILDTARSFREVLDRPVKKVPSLRGVTVCNAFFEPSTRTRLSFELAEKRLSGDVINFSSSGSSVSKGETLKDTVRNIEAMAVDMVVIRHGASGAPHYLARNIDARVINAGDGFHEHPTQGLLDLYTMREKRGTLDGLRVAIVGDIAHSRVARSNIWGLKKFDTDIALVGPQTLLPAEIERLGVRVTHRLEEGLEGADVVVVLRLQLERMESGLLPTLREYALRFGLGREDLERQPQLLVMHPGPINRGVEIEGEVADGPESVILEQVANGVAVRMAVCFLIWGNVRSGAELVAEPV